MAEDFGIRSVTRFSVRPSSERDKLIEDLTTYMQSKSYGEIRSWGIYLQGSDLVALEIVIETEDPEQAEYITDLVVENILNTFTEPKSSAYHDQVTRGSNRLTPA